ncbi:MAG: hypothetical protein WC516_09170 [Patescibacteria group bacterium]|jgi:hypothetical protein
MIGKTNSCSQGYDSNFDCPFEDWRSTYKGDKEMIVAFTRLGQSSDILIREINREKIQYYVEVRRELKIQHDAPFGKDYEAAEKFYDSILAEYVGE